MRSPWRPDAQLPRKLEERPPAAAGEVVEEVTA